MVARHGYLTEIQQSGVIHRECISKEAGRGRQLQLARSVFPPRYEFLRSFVQTTLLSEIFLSSLFLSLSLFSSA